MRLWVFVLLATGHASAHHNEFHQPTALSFNSESQSTYAYAVPVQIYSAQSAVAPAAEMYTGPAPAIYSAPGPQIYTATIAQAPQLYAPIAPAPQYAVQSYSAPSYLAQSYSAPTYSAPNYLALKYSAPATSVSYKSPVKTYSKSSYTSPVKPISTPQYSAVKYQAPSVKYQPSPINQYSSTVNAKPVAILRQSQDDNFDGSFKYEYQAENGIASSASGYVKQLSPKEQVQVIQGQYSYTAPDGTPVMTRWFADETGFHAEGAHLPVAPPVPEAIAKSLSYQGVSY